MGVVSNKIDITDLQLSGGGGGDPTIPGRVEALETVTSGLVKDVNDLETVVGDSTSGLVKDVNELKGATETIYSTTETLIGEWIDGKPLYQKTVTLITPQSDATEHYIAIGAIDIDTIVKIDGIVKFASNHIYGGISPINLTGAAISGSEVKGLKLRATDGSHTNPNSISITVSESSYAGLSAWVTVRYTKTTD